VAAVAAALRCAARSLEQSDSPGIADGIDRAADRIDDLARFVGQRDWRELAVETAAFARRRPGCSASAPLRWAFSPAACCCRKIGTDPRAAAKPRTPPMPAGQTGKCHDRPGQARRRDGPATAGARAVDGGAVVGAGRRHDPTGAPAEALLKFELGQKLAEAAHGAVALAAGAVIMFSGWCALLAAATLALCAIVVPWLAALIIAFANLSLGAGLLYFGRRRLRSRSFALRRTVRSLREDAALIKERVR
jgi:hypothetical protein